MTDYKTVDGEYSAEYEIKRSRFIANVAFVDTEEKAKAFVGATKKKYFDARHNPYAWIIGERGEKQKSNDDGEPGGTGGNPVLDAIKKQNLTNVAIVVTRYFGGIKLGASGLFRAYGHTAALALDSAAVVVMRKFCRVRIVVAYPLFSAVDNYLRQKNVAVDSADYGEKISLVVLITPDETQTVDEELKEITAAGCSFEIIGEKSVALKQK